MKVGVVPVRQAKVKRRREATRVQVRSEMASARYRMNGERELRIVQGYGLEVGAAERWRGNVAVACECGMEERAGKLMERARIPKRYEHCDFESYVTDLADGKTWTAQMKNL